MDFERFKEWAKKEVSERSTLNIMESDLVLEDVTKLGRRYTGLTIRNEEYIISPTIDLDAFYEMYRGGVASEVVADMMTRVMDEHMPDTSWDVEWISDYSQVRDKLIVCLCNAEYNSAFLENVPHLIREDLALTCHIIYEVPGEGNLGAVVSYGLLEEYGISSDELFRDAFESSMKIMPLNKEFVRNIVGSEEEYDERNPFYRLMMISNMKYFRGAAALFYPGTAERVAAELGGSYFILPSYIHEVLALPATPSIDIEDLELMVLEANLLHVPPEERLSDNVYMYSAETGRFFRVNETDHMN